MVQRRVNNWGLFAMSISHIDMFEYIFSINLSLHEDKAIFYHVVSQHSWCCLEWTSFGFKFTASPPFSTDNSSLLVPWHAPWPLSIMVVVGLWGSQTGYPRPNSWSKDQNKTKARTENLPFRNLMWQTHLRRKCSWSWGSLPFWSLVLQIPPSCWSLLVNILYLSS